MNDAALWLGALSFTGPPLALKNRKEVFRMKNGSMRLVNRAFLAAIPDYGNQLLAQKIALLNSLQRAGFPRELPIRVDRETKIRLRVDFWLSPKQAQGDQSIPDFDNIYTALVDMLKKIGVLSDDRFLLCPVDLSEIAGADPSGGRSQVAIYSDCSYTWRV